MRRRSFLQISAAALAAFGATVRRAEAQTGDAFDVSEKSITQLQAAMAAGQVTSEQLVSQYVARIKAYDQAGPRLNSVIAVNPRAAADARELDRERRERGPRGPLHGIPVLLKDNFDTADMPTTGGSLALVGIVPTQDAYQVRMLRRAGAVLLGKLNLHELALGLTSVSSYGGQTLNPYDLTRAPGGSSGGSGVATSACFAAFTLGTDTSGSIRIPSSHNSIVGLRPSLGLSSRAGIIPFGHTQDTGGPMARTVEDVALILDATVGYDAADPSTAVSSGRMPRTYLSSLKTGALKRARIGVLTEFFGTAPEDAEVAAVVRRAIDEMKALGATAIDVNVPELAKLVAAANLLTQELKFYLGSYLKNAGAHATSVGDLLESGLHSSSLQGILDIAHGIADDYLSSDDYRARLAARDTLGKAVVAVMEANRLDAIVYPTIRRIAPVIGGAQAGSNAALSANTGFPALTVPAGFTPGGFPVGVELIGRPFAEPTLLALAFDYEQATHHRRPPMLDTDAAASSTPREGETAAARADVTATGARSSPPSKVAFQATARFTFTEQTRELAYAVRISGTLADVGGVYLHRRATRQNGGVAYVLTRSPGPTVTGVVTLTAAEAGDLKAGKFYLAVISAKSPRLSARGDLVLS
jgi:Asp-tRNA(Asn)/Glu-tRNA(Gln) amidotransferase A subunit family amidase